MRCVRMIPETIEDRILLMAKYLHIINDRILIDMSLKYILILCRLILVEIIFSSNQSYIINCLKS